MTQTPRPPLVTSADRPCSNPFQIGKGRRTRGWHGHGQEISLYALPATLHRAGALVYTDGVITSNGAVDVDCKVQIDVASYRMQQSANYIDGDVRLLILASQVTTDDELTVSGQRYKIYATSRDPAGAYWDCAGRVS